MKKNRIKIIAIGIITVCVFFGTLFALAENTNGNSLFSDSDQDGLTDQEEKMIGADPQKADTDSDGYSDGKEVRSGYNPLKAAPGDKILPDLASPDSQKENENNQLSSEVSSISESDLLDFSSDPNNPNLTNEMIGQLLSLTNEKASSSEDFVNNPDFSSEELSQITQKALETTNITQDLPEIEDSELKILPPLDEKKYKADKLKEKQKEEIEKYLTQVAFVLASNTPFVIENPSEIEGNINVESANFLNALAIGDKTKIDFYAQKVQAGIEQMKKIEVPYILKDIHKTALQLTLYMLDQKDKIILNASDPLKSLVAASSLQTVAVKSTELQSEILKTLSDYEIDFIKFP